MTRQRKAAGKPKSLTWRRICDTLDNVPWAAGRTDEEIIKRIRTRSPEYALAYIKGAVEYSCMVAIRAALDPPKPQQRRDRRKT